MEWTWKSTAMMGVGTKIAPLIHACSADPRFPYFLYLPKGFTLEKASDFSLLVAIHDTFRNAESLKNRFAEFADANRCAVLAPLFPTGIVDPQDLHNYKFITYQGIRFDEVVLSMVQEVCDTFGISGEKFLLYGFSGGGQFSHRFLYLHPQRLKAVVVAAPGRPTYLDDSMAWPNGTKDFENVFGKKLDMEAMGKVPTLVMVGQEDNKAMDYSSEPGDSEDTYRYGHSRLEKNVALADNYKTHGLNVALRIIPGAAHDDKTMLPEACSFFAEA